MRRINRVSFLAIALLTATSIGGGEIVENPKIPSLEQKRPELDIQFLREHAPVVSVLLVEEDHGASLVTYSLGADNGPQEALLITQSEDGAGFKRSIKVNTSLRDHLRGLEKLSISTLVDDEIYFPGASISIWITGLHDQKLVRIRVPPSNGEFSFSGDGQVEDPDLVAWTRKLFRAVLNSEKSTVN